MARIWETQRVRGRGCSGENTFLPRRPHRSFCGGVNRDSKGVGVVLSTRTGCALCLCVCLPAEKLKGEFAVGSFLQCTSLARRFHHRIYFFCR